MIPDSIHDYEHTYVCVKWSDKINKTSKNFCIFDNIVPEIRIVKSNKSWIELCNYINVPNKIVKKDLKIKKKTKKYISKEERKKFFKEHDLKFSFSNLHLDK